MTCRAVIFDMDGVLIDRLSAQICEPMPGTEQLLKILKANNLKVAIASGSDLERIEAVVEQFNWQNYFDALVSTDHVNFMSKPDPAVYTQAAKMLKVAPELCVAVEDSVNGVRAAKKAGMRCIAAINERWSFGDFSEADLIVKSLDDELVFSFLKCS